MRIEHGGLNGHVLSAFATAGIPERANFAVAQFYQTSGVGVDELSVGDKFTPWTEIASYTRRDVGGASGMAVAQKNRATRESELTRFL